MNTNKTHISRLLSLDGGGLKGIFSIAVLAHLEELFEDGLMGRVDRLVGASTGGIIATGLALGRTPREVLEFYETHGPKIFEREPSSSPLAQLRQYWEPKYKSEPLEVALKELYGEQSFCDAQLPLTIPSYDLDTSSIKLFSSDDDSLHHLKAWQVVMAATAAPTFFPAYTDVAGHRLIDGGVWANNPVMVGVTKALKDLDDNVQLKVFSLGTGDQIPEHPEELDSAGMWQWSYTMLDIFFLGQSQSATQQAKDLLGEEHVVRLDPVYSDQRFALDNVNPEEISRLGTIYADLRAEDILSVLSE